MKTSAIPAVRVRPELRTQIEAVLGENESMSQFVETSVRESVLRRQVQAEFVARGLDSLADAKRTDQYIDAQVVVGNLQQKFDLAKSRRVKAPL